MIAYHFPPQRGSSGIQRTLRFARYLPEFGWEPQVLTVHPRAHEDIGPADEIPPGLVVHRALAFDAARHFAIAKRYPSFLARPDRWASWWWGGVVTGLRVISRSRPDALWSTYPIATAHAIAHTLARITRVPWIADFRDPMAQDGYPANPVDWRAYERIEARTLRRAVRSVFASPGAARMYRERYPKQVDRITLIENGYDEESFVGIERKGSSFRRPLVLLHSGIVYPSERDPTALFEAVEQLRDQGQLNRGEFLLRFRAPVHESLLHELTRRYKVEGLIDIATALPYREALQEMLDADALLVLQAANCNEQIPAKVYEYLRAGRPILSLADPAGDTAAVMRAAGVMHVAALENASAIADAFARFVGDVRAGVAPIPHEAAIRGASRRERTAALARLLDEALEADV
jgi:glycosyltransferase involved in cell wall biosynthesis